MKSFSRRLVPLALIFGLAGCGSSQNTSTNEVAGNEVAGSVKTAAGPTTGKTAAFKVALLTPGDINDQGWNQLAYEGLQAVEKQVGAQTSHQWTKTAADQLPALRDYADQGFNLVICHGFEYGERVKSMARAYPKIRFVVVGGNVQQEPNVATLVPKLEDATYLLGMAAGGLTKTDVIGAIGGLKLPVITSTFLAYEAGARAVNPKVRVLTNYLGSFDDQSKGKESARGMMAQKADFLFHNADQAGKGMFNAAQEAPGVQVFGSNSDQNALAPKVCLASAVINMPRAFVQLARDVQNNTFKAEFRELNIGNGDIFVAWNPALKSTIPPALMQKIEAAQKKIQSGALKIKRNV